MVFGGIRWSTLTSDRERVKGLEKAFVCSELAMAVVDYDGDEVGL